jgi:hypothetical protein
MRFVKYPKTNYLPWSRSIGEGDRVLKHMDIFENQRVIVTEKMDGENTTMYHSKIHARSLDSVNHPSRNWVKNYWASIQYNIPHDIRICGENCFAKHSIHYTKLPSYFLGFNAWKENTCLEWDETMELFSTIGISPVKVLYDDIYDENLIRTIPINESKCEGYVMRLARSFTMDEFPRVVGKYVRENHVQTDEHWMKGPMIPNILKEITL